MSKEKKSFRIVPKQTNKQVLMLVPKHITVGEGISVSDIIGVSL